MPKNYPCNHKSISCHLASSRIVLMASKPYSSNLDEMDDPRAISAQARGTHLDNPDATHAAQLGGDRAMVLIRYVCVSYRMKGMSGRMSL